MKASELLVEFYDPQDDQSLQSDMSDTRRPRLTLRHLHKLRKMRELKALDKANHLVFVQSMYGSGDSDDDSGELI